MNIRKINDPWLHTEVTEYFSFSEFKKIQEYFTALEIDTSSAITIHFENDKKYNGEVSSSHIISVVKSFNVKRQSMFCNELDEIFKKRYKEYLTQCNINPEQDNYYFDFSLMIQPPNFLGHIHLDHACRANTLIIHISEEGTGTGIYTDNNDDGFVKYTDWHPNGGVGWMSNEASWHRVVNNKSTDRYIFRSMLFDRNIPMPNGLKHA